MAKRDYIFHNFWWKVTSLLLAVIVWFVVYGSENTTVTSQRTFEDHPLAIMRDSADKRPIRVTPSKVTVVIKAPIMDVTRLTVDDIQTFVDLNEVSITQRKARIRIYVPRGVSLESITPDEATVEFLE